MNPPADFTTAQGARLLDALTDLISAASAAVMAARDVGLRATRKPDASPVTAADRASERVLLDGLAAILPGLPVLSEECGATALLGPAFALIDPLDGTRELLAGRDEFCINLALIQDGAPVAGLIAAPALSLVWRGARGFGAERLSIAPGHTLAQAKAHDRIRTRPCAAPIVAMVSRSHPDAASDAYLSRYDNVERIALGSALKFCRLAEGAADVYVRLGTICEWDIAAGHALLEAAGGTMTRADHSPLTYNHPEDSFRVGGFLAYGDPALAGKSVRD